MDKFLLVVLAFSLGVLITRYTTILNLKLNKDEFSWFKSSEYKNLLKKYEISVDSEVD